MSVPQEFIALNPSHFDVKAFDCGKPDMNAFLARFAAKNMGLGLSSTWVLPARHPEEGAKTPMAAYYTLASSTVSKAEIPVEAKLPNYPVPVVLLARLAVDKAYQGKRYGEKTLVSALRHSVQLTDNGLPAIGLILDLLDDDAKAFYDRFDMFQPFTDDPMRLFVPMNVLRQI
ncbi:GNAT family N-acetyltransferase [Parahaliea maris]|uniref:GNAT family N-acetyltransferase n=1 Tax=Parahaliea maris TaxID=2716870 RepID=A0A5C9A0B5_9GAMM|nr:GNAT family N-acetyltransferase [Parahaliea maris]TXS94206.1 GNAT family N-acetyltransferase [Parahaliea maris]